MAPILRSLMSLASFMHFSNGLAIQRSDSTPTIPLNEVSGLPSPTSSPSSIVLGIGYQNYTCNATSTTKGVYIQTLTSDGALAELFDISHMVSSSNMDDLSPTALKAFESCSSGSDYVGCHHTAIQAVSRRPDHVGQHFFSPSLGAQSPHFALDEYDLYLAAKKSGSATAPSDAYKGKNGLGAVPWLYLVANGDAYTQDLQSVYRVETAGGTAPGSCSTSQAGSALSVPYAAQYWFYD